jgi:hypothetical protein
VFRADVHNRFSVHAPKVFGLVAARLSAGSKFNDTSEVAGVFIGNNPNQKCEGQNGGDYQFPVAPGYRVMITHLALLFRVVARAQVRIYTQFHCTCWKARRAGSGTGWLTGPLRLPLDSS